MFDDNAVHDVGNVVEPINNLFQMVINFISSEKRQSAPPNVRSVEFVHSDIVQFIRTAFQCGNLGS